MQIDKKRPRSDEAIAFTGKDLEGVQFPHSDALVIKLKLNSHRVCRVLVDTGSSADILFIDAFEKWGTRLAS